MQQQYLFNAVAAAALHPVKALSFPIPFCRQTRRLRTLQNVYLLLPSTRCSGISATLCTAITLFTVRVFDSRRGSRFCCLHSNHAGSGGNGCRATVPGGTNCWFAKPNTISTKCYGQEWGAFYLHTAYVYTIAFASLNTAGVMRFFLSRREFYLRVAVMESTQ